jgi:hypothetical protein
MSEAPAAAAAAPADRQQEEVKAKQKVRKDSNMTLHKAGLEKLYSFVLLFVVVMFRCTTFCPVNYWS